MPTEEKMVNNMFETRDLAGVPITVANLDEAVSSLCQRRLGSGADIHLINAYSIALTSKEPQYRTCLVSAFANFPDGKPLSWISQLSGLSLSQVRGPSLFEAVISKGREVHLRHFLLGSTPETLAALDSAIGRKFPGALVVGVESPPFRPLTSDELREQDARIAQAKPDIVWVGLGTPKQDFEAQRLAAAGFTAVAVGAAFDFTAGLKKEAPAWMTAVGLEWLFRLSTEPRRLWRRYLFGNFRFLWTILRSWKS